MLAAAVGGGSWFGDTSWAASQDDGPAAGWSIGLVDRRPRRDGCLPRVVRVARSRAHAARAARPGGVRDRVHGAGHRLPAPRHRPLPDLRPDRVSSRTARCRRTRFGSSSTDRLERSRLTVFFRLLLAIPHLIWLLLWSVLALLAVLVAWVVALVIGRVPRALHRFIAAWVRYAMHVVAFLFLVGGPFPGFVGAAGSYPVDLAIDPPQRQRRLVTLFRGLLAIPALLLGGAYSAVVLIVGAARLVGGALHRPDAGGDAQPRRGRRSATPARRTRTSSSSPTATRTRRPPFATAPRDEQLELASHRTSRVPGSSRPEPRRPRHRRSLSRSPPGSSAPRSSSAPRCPSGLHLPRVDVDAVFGKAARPRGRPRRAVLPRHLGARADRALRDALDLRAARAAVRTRVGRRADRHRDAARHARARDRLARRSCRSRCSTSGGRGGTT